MTPPRAYINSSIADSTGLEIHELPDNEFIPYYNPKKFSKLQKDTLGQFMQQENSWYE